MKRNYTKASAYIVIALIILSNTFFVSCNEDNIATPTDDPIASVDNKSDGIIVLGEQLENPYSVENMQKALDALNSSGMSTKSNLVIEPTHLYVRFLPKMDEELQILKSDSTLILYTYPMDFEIETNGDYYHDPSLPDTAITWQYTVVEPDFVFPNIQYEILSELYLLEEDDIDDMDSDIISTKNGSVALLDWYALEDMSLELTGNIEESNGEFISKRSKWRPAGKITVYDDIVGGNIPLVGALVRARRWFTTHSGYTDSNGKFSCDGRFRRDAN